MNRKREIIIILCAVLTIIAAYVWNSGKEARPAIGISNIIGFSGHSVQYYELGNGDTVVLLASLGRSVSDFNELADSLSKSGFRTVAVELRGVGATTGSGFLKKLTHHDYADDVVAVIKNLGSLKNGKVHIIGHAFGNRIARTLASDHPELVRSVILIAAGGYVPIPKDIKKAMYTIFLNFLSDSIREKNIRKAFFATGNTIPEYWISGWYFRASWLQSRATLATPREEWWSGGKAPILLLQAEHDVIAPAENANAMKKEFGDRVTVVMVPDAGHAMLPEQPDFIRDSIVSFLKNH